MSFVIKRLHFALNWLLSCGERWSKLDGGVIVYPWQLLVPHHTVLLKSIPWMAPGYA